MEERLLECLDELRKAGDDLQRRKKVMQRSSSFKGLSQEGQALARVAATKEEAERRAKMKKQLAEDLFLAEGEVHEFRWPAGALDYWRSPRDGGPWAPRAPLFALKGCCCPMLSDASV